jgi:hypothetical protein
MKQHKHNQHYESLDDLLTEAAKTLGAAAELARAVAELVGEPNEKHVIDLRRYVTQNDGCASSLGGQSYQPSTTAEAASASPNIPNTNHPRHRVLQPCGCTVRRMAN